eukprot:CAMPEP_0197077542 /NCGR_PEP_ID=MMETSP1384-20130603/212674_1 /TAXON_ID=29189 /ORGANISM="Ammonia sp." /LENGTH=121 /DNA_ID=CAMNT_0042516407 /DNA_START=1065 /DNA_END=1429 /DNA_ORIENTATION=+
MNKYKRYKHISSTMLSQANSNENMIIGDWPRMMSMTMQNEAMTSKIKMEYKMVKRRLGLELVDSASFEAILESVDEEVEHGDMAECVEDGDEVFHFGKGLGEFVVDVIAVDEDEDHDDTDD